MELRSHAKRRRSKELAAGEPPPWTTEAPDPGNPGPAAHSKEPPPPPPDAGGVDDDDGVDRISGLLDAVLGEILSLLSTKEAGRTQILASRWRHVWLDSPLVLDGADLYNPFLGDSSADFDSDGEEETLTAAFQALAGAVSHVLSAHPGPVRRFCIPSFYLHNRPATVDAWLSSPKLDSLQELQFCETYDTIWGMNWYIIRPQLLPPPPASTFRFSATLQVATLGKCELPDSLVEGIYFPLLKQLGLEGVSISEGSLHTMISSCPVLECLLLKGNIGVACLRISSNSLRSIGMRADVSGYWGYPQLLQEVIIVDAPCLERFLYLDASPYTSKAITLTVISAPKLETLGCLKEGSLGHQRLVFGTTAIQGLNVVSLTTALSTVKTLAIASEHIDLDRVIELMKCFPCLEKLYIKSSISGKRNRWHPGHKDFVESFDIRLKTIMMKQYRGTTSQVNFASFFVLNARELESLRLDVGLKDYNEAFFTKQHEMLQMEKRASRGARLHFTKKTCTRHVHVNHVHDLSIADPFECRC